jgi:hypothetical protein
MSAIDRSKLHKDIDELADDQLPEIEAAVLLAKHKKTHPGSAWARALYELFAPIREAIAATGMTEEEIDKVIDDAIDEVRRERKT